MEKPAFEQTTDAVMMVYPVDFGRHVSLEGVASKLLQKVGIKMSDQELQKLANEEFEKSVRRLRQEGLDVMVLKHPHSDIEKKAIPDAVYCNNWISTHQDGTVIVYPMKDPRRRRETFLQDIVNDLLIDHGYYIRNIIRIGCYNEPKFLEGTGAMVLDHEHRTIYVCKSKRCNLLQLNNFIETTKHFNKVIVFRAVNSKEQPIYHTDIVMCVGKRFAVIGSECIIEPEPNSGYATRQEALDELRKHHHVIELTMDQVENKFCGNILEVKTASGTTLIVMSTTAYNGFTEEQRHQLEQFGKLVAIDIPTLEQYGGGSARCLLMECFLPKKDVYYLINQNLPKSLLKDE